MLELKNIRASYHKGYPILKDINLLLKEDEKIAILGRNGAGKTSFANAIFGLMPYISGALMFNGNSLRSLSVEQISSLGIAYFMQGAPVFPQMSIRENLLISAGHENFYERFHILKEIFPLLQSGDSERMAAGTLSGGERTQLALAMVLFKNPGLLILDEPFAGLSPSNATIILNALNDFQVQAQSSVILIAQDRHLAEGFCTKHYVIRDGNLISESK
jgi:branched-chain amino acid transport system ATP-binding protein